MPWDCQRCGACCHNPAVNRAEGFSAYVEVDDPKSKLLRDASMRGKYVTFHDGRPHLRLHQDRCAALSGALGREVRCTIYAHRPRPCRRVQPGDADCLTARQEHGLEV